MDEREEKYGLNWHGKRQARQLALTPSARARSGHARKTASTGIRHRNLMIEGDNLEVLKLLQKSYAGKVKLIYIDPPYNTGKEFIYSRRLSGTVFGTTWRLTAQSRWYHSQ